MSSNTKPFLREPFSQPNPVAAKQSARTGVSLYGSSVEYSLHCLLWLIAEDVERASSRDLAELQGVPSAVLAKIMPRLQKAGIVNAIDGIAGGYALARPASEITVLDVIDAVEAHRRLFDCKEVRRSCVLFGNMPPDWATGRMCGIHAVMLRAEDRMRAELAQTSLADLGRGVRMPSEFGAQAASWIRDRGVARNTVRIAAVKQSRAKPRET